MTEKPRQWHTDYASIFKDKSVARAYEYRPTYPPEVIRILRGFIKGMPKPWHVLDAGCGTGFIARDLVPFVDHLDAIDFSQAMIEKGKTLPGGDNPKLSWICAPIEEAPLRASYSLIVTAASLHWLDWETVLPRFARVLVDGGYLAVVENISLPSPWDKGVAAVLGRYSQNRHFQPYTMLTIVGELEARQLFEQAGQHVTEPTVFQQSVDDWLESFHARNGFSRNRMSVAAAGACDEALRDIIIRYCPDGIVSLKIAGRVIWGHPKSR